MKIGVIGFGSIGERHCRNLLQIGFSDISLLRKNAKGNNLNLKEYYSDEEFFKNDFEAVILCNRTCDHHFYLTKWLPSQKNVFVEKPLVANREELKKVVHQYKNFGGVFFVGMNMRFHPCIKYSVKKLSQNAIGKVLYSRFFVGQYLPDWRPNQDYTKSYSAQSSLGGGVVLDLIHEIDLAVHIHGKPKSEISSLASKISNLQITSEDIAEINFISISDTLVSIHMDYLIRGYERSANFYGEAGSLKCDLYKNEIFLYDEKGKEIENVSFKDFERNTMYVDEMKNFINCVLGREKPVVTIDEAINSLEIAFNVKAGMI